MFQKQKQVKAKYFMSQSLVFVRKEIRPIGKNGHNNTWEKELKKMPTAWRRWACSLTSETLEGRDMKRREQLGVPRKPDPAFSLSGCQ